MLQFWRWALLSVSIQLSRPAVDQSGIRVSLCNRLCVMHIYGMHGHTSGVWLAPLLCLQGDKTVKVVPVKQQPPITVADLFPGETYRLRVYSHELNSVSSKPVEFKTKAGEATPGQVEAGFQLVAWSPCSSLIVSQ